jgi:hypothetical protein
LADFVGDLPAEGLPEVSRRRLDASEMHLPFAEKVHAAGGHLGNLTFEARPTAIVGQHGDRETPSTPHAIVIDDHVAALPGFAALARWSTA